MSKSIPLAALQHVGASISGMLLFPWYFKLMRRDERDCKRDQLDAKARDKLGGRLIEEPAYTHDDVVDHDAVAMAIPGPGGVYLALDHVKFNWWTIPLGKCNPGQSLAGSVAMELNEELGLESVTFLELAQQRFRYIREGLTVEVNLHLVEVTAFRGRPENREPHKHRSLRWLSLNELFNLNRTADGTLMLLQNRGFPMAASRWCGTPVTSSEAS
ncbi:NUDIX domain-containing protein [Arthrobacter sp. LAPM80]|uniref:NUDIX domain-containing protein n=1 Tax=Arthrobacter sp. LAPM80 TaxID=3141788 RepID=UPI00398A5683